MTVQQASIERIFLEKGYVSSTDYAIKKIREELLNELKVCLGRIEILEQKYGMSYEEFYKHFDVLTQFSLFERENDAMDWRAELTVLRGVEKRLTWLTA